MTLNLARIVPSPYFRSYWVQRNITAMKQYQAAVSDLYRTPGSFREERVLIPKSPDAAIADTDLAPVLRYLPANSGVYRATAQPGTAAILDELNRRLIARDPAPYRDMRIAPVADLSDGTSGSSGDLDTRIDEQPVPELPLAAALAPLRSAIDAAGVNSMLVYSSANGTASSANGTAADAAPGVFFPVHTAVILQAERPWDETALRGALTAALAPRFTVAQIGAAWQPAQQDGVNWLRLSGLQPLAMAIRGQTLVVASDPETLLAALRASQANPGSEQLLARTVAGFSHSAERERFLRLTGLFDHVGDGLRRRGMDPSGQAPAFFSGNIGSLTESFKALDSQIFVERSMPSNRVRQTVVYTWRR